MTDPGAGGTKLRLKFMQNNGLLFFHFSGIMTVQTQQEHRNHTDALPGGITGQRSKGEHRMYYICSKPYGANEPWKDGSDFRSREPAREELKRLIAKKNPDGTWAYAAKLCIGKGRDRRDVIVFDGNHGGHIMEETRHREALARYYKVKATIDPQAYPTAYRRASDIRVLFYYEHTADEAMRLLIASETDYIDDVAKYLK